MDRNEEFNRLFESLYDFMERCLIYGAPMVLYISTDDLSAVGRACVELSGRPELPPLLEYIASSQLHHLGRRIIEESIFKGKVHIEPHFSSNGRGYAKVFYEDMAEREIKFI